MTEPNIPQDATLQIPAEIRALAVRAPAFIRQVKPVTNGEEMTLAMSELTQIKNDIKTHKPARDAFLAHARASLKFNEDFFDNFAGPILAQLNDAKTQWEQKIVLYRQEAQRQADEENRKRREELERQQNELRAKQAAANARAAQEAEKKRQQAEAAAAAGRRAQAAKYEAQASQIESTAQVQASVTEQVTSTMKVEDVQPDVPKTDAGGFRTTYSARVISLSDLICAVAGAIRAGVPFPPENLLKPDQTALNSLARSLKEHFAVPGVVAEADTKTFSRGAR